VVGQVHPEDGDYLRVSFRGMGNDGFSQVSPGVVEGDFQYFTTPCCFLTQLKLGFVLVRLKDNISRINYLSAIAFSRKI